MHWGCCPNSKYLLSHLLVGARYTLILHVYLLVHNALNMGMNAHASLHRYGHTDTSKQTEQACGFLSLNIETQSENLYKDILETLGSHAQYHVFGSDRRCLFKYVHHIAEEDFIGLPCVIFSLVLVTAGNPWCGQFTALTKLGVAPVSYPWQGCADWKLRSHT